MSPVTQPPVFRVPEDPKHLKAYEKIDYGDTLPNTVEPLGVDEEIFSSQIEENEARFAITPLYTYYHEMALPNEYMIDRFTGAGAIKREDGSVINIQEVTRLNHHLSELQNTISFNLMDDMTIYDIVPEFDCEVMIYDGYEIVDDPVSLYKPSIKKGFISIDASFLKKRNDCVSLMIDNCNPKVVITYRINGTDDDVVIEDTLADLRQRQIEFNCQQIQLTSIKFPEILPEDDRLIIIHSILVAI